jgi:hypothetical protein
MGKIKRATRTGFPRAAATSHTKSIEDHSTESFAPKRGTPRRGTGGDASQSKPSILAADEGTLDEWLEPGEDKDLDQWLHEHGGDGSVDD